MHAPPPLAYRIVAEARRNWWAYAGGIYLAALVVMACFGVMLGGCAAGRGPAGEVVLGFDVASLPESASEVAASAAKFLPEPFQSIAIGAGTLLLGGGAGALAKRSTKAAADEARAREQQAWDEAHRVTMATYTAPPVAPTVAGGVPAHHDPRPAPGTIPQAITG